MRLIEIYIDGSANYKNRFGGFGVVIMLNGEIKRIFAQSHSDTTNNRMELGALLRALEKIKPHKLNKKCVVQIYTDSMYVSNGFNKYMHKWSLNNFNGIKNPDLWKKVYDRACEFPIQYLHVVWIKGHAGNIGNELADRLAKLGYIKNFKPCHKVTKSLTALKSSIIKLKAQNKLAT